MSAACEAICMWGRVLCIVTFYRVPQVSVACEAICMWCHAMRKYYYVSKEVEPKRIQLAAGQEGVFVSCMNHVK